MDSAKIKRFFWAPEPTELFLDLWQAYIGDLRSPRVNAHIYQEMAKKMCMFDITHVEVKAKVDNMTKKYRIELNRSIDGRPSKWVHFQKVQEILCESPPLKGGLVMANSLDFSPFDDSDDYDSDSPNHAKDTRFTDEPIQELSSAKEKRQESPASVQSEFLSIKSTRIPTKRPASVQNEYSARKAARIPTKRPASVRSDSAYSVNTYRPASMDKEITGRLLAIEEEKLAIQKEKLRTLKNIADGLSSVHRDFLKFYKHNYKNNY